MAQLTFPNEVEIILDEYFITIFDAQAQIREFGKRFEWADNGLDPKYAHNRNKIDSKHASIKMVEFLKLYYLAENAAQNANATAKEYVTGIRVKVGASKREGIRLFYQPVFITKKDRSTNDLFVGQIHSALSNKLMYEYNDDSEAFEMVLESDVIGSRKLYHENMCMMGIDGDNEYRRAVISNDWTGDTKSAVYSFQELFKLYELNYSGIDPSFNYSAEIKVFNGAIPKPNPQGGRDPRRYKHTLLFSRLKNGRTNVIDENFPGGPPEEDQLADLGHLCPPATNCDGVEYPTGP